MADAYVLYTSYNATDFPHSGRSGAIKLFDTTLTALSEDRTKRLEITRTAVSNGRIQNVDGICFQCHSSDRWIGKTK